jgi:glyoxylase-like metal-dependent hydrolase (beta-lactamase superfamily II)
MRMRDITRLDLGYFTMPDRPGDPLSGQPIVVCAYLLRHPRGLFLWDTGLAKADAETEEHYHPVTWPVDAQLRSLGVAPGDIAAVANCHLHFDHSGGNRHFPNRPIFAQRTEYAAAHEPDYTMPIVVEFANAAYELLDGEAEVWPGLTVIPTPGHTDGHQTLVVDTDDGRVALAGQSFNTTSEFASAEIGWQLQTTGWPQPGSYPAWMERLEAFDPVRVLFAHDVAVWERGELPPPVRPPEG